MERPFASLPLPIDVNGDVLGSHRGPFTAIDVNGSTANVPWRTSNSNVLAKLLLIDIDVLPSGPFTVIDVNRGRENGYEWAMSHPIDVNGGWSY